MKPRIRLEKSPPRPGYARRWFCFSTRGDGVSIVGYADTPKEAYAKWCLSDRFRRRFQ